MLFWHSHADSVTHSTEVPSELLTLTTSNIKLSTEEALDHKFQCVCKCSF